MKLKLDDCRLYKSQLARRFSCSTRTIHNWWVAGILPARHYDEFRRPFNYASEIAEHEMRLPLANGSEWPELRGNAFQVHRAVRTSGAPNGGSSDGDVTPRAEPHGS